MASARRFLLRLVSLFRSDRAEADLTREIDTHLRVLEDKFIAQGMSADDAHMAARRAFGGIDHTKEYQRDARSFRWLDTSWLDFKLGFRMLIKYPGLTLVGGLAIAFAIAVGAATFEFIRQAAYPSLPLADGDRIVGIRLWHTEANGVEEQAGFDFLRWRQDVRSIEDLGAFRTLERNLAAGDSGAEPVWAAELSASAFRVARVTPVLGRFLVDADEHVAAPPVIVIGYDIWQARFAADRDVVGRTVQFGVEPRTVVGVMPKGFAFPVDHNVWVPLRPSSLEHGPRRGPWLQIFGRLASGVTLDEAQTELTTIGLRTAAELSDTHRHIRPQVMPYGQSVSSILTELSPATLMSINVFFVMLMVLISANVALLMFARAATREAEIAVRNALGASRGRIIGQLFAESLVLGSLAAVAGLAAAGFALRWWLSVSRAENEGGRLAFWFSDRLSPETILYAAALAVLGAAIAGVVPALKVTGRSVETRLRHASAGGGGLRFGGLWSWVIVTQVAVTLAFPATALFVRRSIVQVRSLDVGFPSEQYLSVRLERDWEPLPGVPSETARLASLARFGVSVQELARRVAAEPGIVGVTFAKWLPRTHHPRRLIEVEEPGAVRSGPRFLVGSVPIAVDYFDVLRAPILSGRGFHVGDFESGARVVIVNQSFVRQILAGRNPIGRRVRYLDPRDERAPQGPWQDIVGVVNDLGMVLDYGGPELYGAGLYHPVAPGADMPMHMAVHMKGDPESFAPRLRTLATAVDPALRLHKLLPLDKVGAELWLEFDFMFRLLILVCGIALLLSLSAIYAVMSFTVSRRTREIGIRVALGSDPMRLLSAIFRQPLRQVALGVVAGGGLVLALTQSVSGLSSKEVGVIVAYMVLMMGVCLLACIVPTRRALGVEPTEALRQD